MGERTATQGESAEVAEDYLDPMLGELGDEEFDELEGPDITTCAQSLAAKRRRAEQRLEALRLREELGDFDFDFEDDF
ncbi:MAG: hypothetical protein L7T24_10000 [Luminiphilus sp.]|nr:hypothetical protein [Luminiphilus sp.]